mmetsp:Transcript_22245/g.39896  ORF Transcript_22245/g.39896 Transcript_22245/m.39896 type:complete len:134 (-) Transcript_22245:43-444(-)
MPGYQRYVNDGNGRDSYINNVPSHPLPNNVNARVDTLPSNVRGYLRDQVNREQYRCYTDGIRVVGNVNEVMTDGKGKNIPRAAVREAVLEGRYAAREQKSIRQARLKELYSAELEQWNSELHELGYAIEKERD